MPTSNPDKTKQHSVPNVSIQALEVKQKKLTEPEIKGQAGYKKKIIQHCGVFYCTQKGTLLSSITVPEDWTPLISKPAKEHDPESVPFVNVQRHFFKHAPDFYLSTSLAFHCLCKQLHTLWHMARMLLHSETLNLIVILKFQNSKRTVKAQFTLEWITKAQRGSKGIAPLFL